MDEARILPLLEEASDRYNEGRYDQAIALWREVLAQNPANQKAQEGIRMATLLTGDWAAPTNRSQEEAASQADSRADDTLPRIEAGIARVRELVGAGQIAEATEGCALLQEIAPNLDVVRQLAEDVKQAAARPAGPGTRPKPAGARPAPARAPAQASPPMERHLERARQALADGRNSDAAQAARLALEADPSNMEACGILSLVGDDPEIAGPAAPGAETGPMPAFDLEGGPISIEDEPHRPHEPTASVAPGANGRIEGLLVSGQELYDAGRFQDAIEIWSRIFAIDRTNAEAGARIDRAKAAVEDQARHVDELYYHAVDANEANRLEEALGLFEQVLAISPHHLEARSFIEEINLRLGGLGDAIRVDPGAAKEAAEEKRKHTAADAVERGPVDVASVPLAGIGLESPYPPRVQAESVKGSGAATAPIRRQAQVSPRGGGAGRLLAAATGVVLVALAGVGAWLWIGSDSGSMPEARATVPAPVERPARLAPGGPTPPAKGERQNGPSEPPHVVSGAPQADPVPDPRPGPLDPETLKSQAAALTQEGRQFYQQKRWAEAVLAFRKALATDPVDFNEQELLDKSMVELEKQARIEREMGQATKAFNEKDYGTALQKFYRLQQDHPEMRVLDTYIRNSWFDWGVTLLQDGSADEASERFKEVLDLSPNDREAARARDFSKRFHGRQRDAVYDAFAGALVLRTLDQP
ncbi:MAG TPA: tetratricopeptide repeat protein [Candidatus Polarisedimenticolia bacterium]